MLGERVITKYTFSLAQLTKTLHSQAKKSKKSAIVTKIASNDVGTIFLEL